MDAEKNVIVETIKEDTVVARPIDERANADVEIAVNRGIAAAALGGIPEGLKVMEEGGVPRNITVRVLNNKSRRRASDWK
jgi:hypothetical protein